MRLIGLEEPFVTADLLESWRALELRWQDLALRPSSGGASASRLADLGGERLAAMDETGLEVQVLSITAPGVPDYLFEPAPWGGYRRLLEEADLSDADREKIASGNWERLCAGIRR